MRWIRPALGVLLAAAALAIPAGSWAASAQQILDDVKKVNQAREPKDITQTLKMTIYDSGGGQRIRELKNYVKNYGNRTSKAISFFLKPSELKSVGVLAWIYPDKDDDQWIYFPETERVRRLNTTISKDSFGDSDFSYEDTKLFGDLIRDWTKVGTAKLASEHQAVDGVPCAVIEFTPHREDTQYGRLVMWFNQADSTLRKMELYDRGDGSLVKVLAVKDFSTVDNLPTPRRLEMKNVKAGSHTLIEVSDVHYNQGLTDELFTQHSLQRGPST